MGPTGVYVIDTKHWAGRVSAGKGTLWSGRHPQRRALTNLAWETACVAGALTSTGVSAPVSVMSMTGSGRGDRALEIDGTWILPVEMLTDFLTAGPSRIPPGITRPASERLSARRLLRASYPSDPRTEQAQSPADAVPDGPSPRPVPLAPSQAARGQPTLQPTGPEPSGTEPTRRLRPVRYPPPRTTRRPSPSSGKRHIQRRRQEQTKRATQLALGVLAIAIVGVAFGHLPQARPVNHFPTSTLPMTVAAAPSYGGKTPTAVQPSATWSCPAPSAGWTATFPLTGSEQASLGTWALQVATRQQGPWTTKAAGEGVMRLTGLQPDQALWIRGGNISSIEIAGNPAVEGLLTAPAGC